MDAEELSMRYALEAAQADLADFEPSIFYDLLRAGGYTITRIDPEAAAVAELLALERAGKILAWQREAPDPRIKAWNAGLHGADGYAFDVEADSAVELVAEVRKSLKEGTDA